MSRFARAYPSTSLCPREVGDGVRAVGIDSAMLILFDIDMTLLSSDHIGIDCLRDAGRSLFDQDFTVEGIRFGGGLDPVIIVEMLQLNNIAPTSAHVESMRRSYHKRLHALAEERTVATALPGAHELVNAAAAHEAGPALGLLTGNFRETGTIKVSSAGFDPELFTINAWGDSSLHPKPIRAHLPPVAIANYRKAKGVDLAPRSVIIIGDTIHDVACAKDTGCRSLAVATGHDPVSALADAGADLVVDDLTRTTELMEWMMGSEMMTP